MIASVAATVIARIGVGWICDRVGPRRTYSWLLILSSLPVMGIGLAHDYESFLLCRLLIGCIGASFVVTQYHTSVMFAPNCVGTANATVAGWGNLGGGVTQVAMPLLLALLVGGLGLTQATGWRACMAIVGAACFVMGLVYHRYAPEAPPKKKPTTSADHGSSATSVLADPRVWSLTAIYGACFGLELTIDNVAVLYFHDYFGLSVAAAGAVAAAFGGMNLFARALGGWLSDQFQRRWGTQARVTWLFLALFCEGLALMLFSQLQSVTAAVVMLATFGLFVKMSNGATYSVVPFVRREQLGMVSGIVGAGGNVGAVLAGFLFKSSLGWPTAFLILGFAVTLCSFATFVVRLEPAPQPELSDRSALPDLATAASSI